MNPVEESDEKPIQFLLISQLAKDLDVIPPIKAQGIEFQYMFEPSFQLQISSFSSPKFLRSVKQLGKRKFTNVWTIDSIVRSDSGQKQFVYELDFSSDKISANLAKQEN